MFPITQVASSLEKDIKGNCNNRLFERDSSITEGLLTDIDALERKRRDTNSDKLFAIVPKDYFLFHGEGSPRGMVVEPRWREWRWVWFIKKHWFKWGFFGGSWNVAFIKDYTVDEDNNPISIVNGGTVAHELAHTLGQEREFYESNEKCQQFKESPIEYCKDYKIPRALDTWIENNRRIWRFLKNKKSIMNNKRGSITNQWIDRDTYQKTFSVLSMFGAVISSDEELYKKSIVRSDYRKRRDKAFKAVVSGFYYEKKESFILPKMEIYEMNSLTSTFPKIEDKNIPFITLQLKKGDKILQEVKQPILKMNLKLLYEDKAPEVRPFDFSHVIASFELPEDFQNNNLQIVVLSPEGTLIYSSLISQKKE